MGQPIPRSFQVFVKCYIPIIYISFVILRYHFRGCITCKVIEAPLQVFDDDDDASF